MSEKRRSPAEGRGTAGASHYGVDVRLTVGGGHRLGDGSWSVLIAPDQALKLIEDLARSIGEIAAPVRSYAP